MAGNSTSHSNVSILIADDEPAMRQLLASILRAAGYDKLAYAHDGQQALSRLSDPDCDIDIAFLDINMPNFSGLEVMSRAKVVRENCFFVIISAHSALDNVRAAINGGARGFIVKPYTTQRIHDILMKFETGPSACTMARNGREPDCGLRAE